MGAPHEIVSVEVALQMLRGERPGYTLMAKNPATSPNTMAAIFRTERRADGHDRAVVWMFYRDGDQPFDDTQTEVALHDALAEGLGLNGKR